MAALSDTRVNRKIGRLEHLLPTQSPQSGRHMCITTYEYQFLKPTVKLVLT